MADSHYGVPIDMREAQQQIVRQLHANLDEHLRRMGPCLTGPQPELCWAFMEIGRQFGLGHKAHRETVARAVWSGRETYFGRDLVSQLDRVNAAHPLDPKALIVNMNDA